MKKLQTQLKAVAKTLVSLTKKIELMTKQLEKAGTAAAKPVKKAKAAPKKAVKAKTAKAVKVAKKAKPKKAVKVAKTKKVAKTRTAKKAVKAPKAEKAAAGQGTVLDSVFNVIKGAGNGASIDVLKKKTKLEPRQLSNALYKLTKKGMIEARSRGVYFKK